RAARRAERRPGRTAAHRINQRLHCFLEGTFMKEIILAYQGEMTLKGLNRGKFEAGLANSIRRRLEDLGPFKVWSAQSTVFIEPQEEGLDTDEAFRRVLRVFGIVKLSRAACCEKD